MTTVTSTETRNVSPVNGRPLVAEITRTASREGITTTVLVHEPRGATGDWLGDLAAQIADRSASRSVVEPWETADDYTASRLIDECRTEINGGPVLA